MPRSFLFCFTSLKSVGQVSVDVQEVLCHAMVATGRKYLRAPRGTGFLFVSSSIVSDLWPQHIDHYGVPISEVPTLYQDGDAIESILDYSPRKGASRFEFWEANVANRLALGVAIRESIQIGPKHIESECVHLAKLMRDQLTRIPNIVIHHSSSTYCGIVTFYSTIADSQTITKGMQKKGFELSVVPATSSPIDSAKSRVPDLVRTSLSYTNTQEEIESFAQSLIAFLET
jgi:cysteine desulfurase/selenocysteine lyase